MRRKRVRRGRKEIISLIILLIILLGVNYGFLDKSLIDFLNTNKEIHVDRVIDGDTIESNKTSIRMLGINTPERGEFLYEEAKIFLENELLNKNVTLEFIGNRYDKYDRMLAYVFLSEENINVKMVENGFANYYFYSGRDKYSDELLGAWEKCIEKEVNLCEPSMNSCAECVSILDDNTLVNTCSSSCDISNWVVKGEGREKFIFGEIILQSGEEENFALNIENSGGSLFLRDNEGKLVEWNKG